MIKEILSKPITYFIFAILIFIALTFIHPFKDTHVLFNLEPYPDGLFYVTAARNLVLHHKWEVSYQGYVLQPRITPMYSVLLAAGYFLSAAPQMFYVVNVVLGLATLYFLFLLLRQITKDPNLVGLGLLMYLLHGYVYWLPSAPMAENASLCLFTASLWAVLREKKTIVFTVLSSLLLIALFLTKYTLFGPVGALALVQLIHLRKEKKWKEGGAAVLTFLVGGLFFLFYQVHIGFNPFSVFSPKVFNQVSVTKHVFYSFKYFGRNTFGYLQMLAGTKTQLLWLTYPLTTLGLSGFFMVGNVYLFIKNKKMTALLWLALFLSQFPILLVFYVIDARYIILSLPLLAVGNIWILEHVKKKKRMWYLALGFMMLIHLISQLSFFKYLVATNALGRSTAWQYEAVKVFNAEFEHPPKKTYLITALPPLLVDLYSNHQYELLPLSPTQEFADKKQFVWGNDINYTNLPETYSHLLNQNYDVYLTNAYLTSQHEFQEYLEAVKSIYNVEEVKDGCMGTCKIWKLKFRLIVD